MTTTFSGIQPTGALHLGNYLGALKHFAGYQKSNAALYCIVDLHAMTVKHNPAELKANVRYIAAAYLACGIQPDNMFVQSMVPEHTELAWILNCVARLGWMERMPQFRDKVGENSERASVGIFTYPVLQAADILLYHTDEVPVGIDQLQHIELAGEIARKFNKDFSPTGDYFKRPKPIVQENGGKVMSLLDGSMKMSKSDPNDNSRINMTDTPDQIAKKIRKATAHVEPLPHTVEELPNPSVTNLVGIYATVAHITPQAVLDQFGGQGFGKFKPALADLLVAEIEPISEQMNRMLETDHIDSVISAGPHISVRQRAAQTIREVKDLLGLW